MKQTIKIVYSKYYFDEVIKKMLDFSKKNLSGYNLIITEVPGSFEIPFEIARSIKQDYQEEFQVNFKKEEKEKRNLRDNIVQMAKLSQLNLADKSLYSGFLALGCIIKGKTINHEAISTSIFTNLQRISVENIIPIGNGIFNANSLEEAKNKNIKCTQQALKVLEKLLIPKEK